MCLSHFAFLCCDKKPFSQQRPGNGKIVSPYTLQYVIEGSQGKNTSRTGNSVEQYLKIEIIKERCPLACFQAHVQLPTVQGSAPHV